MTSTNDGKDVKSYQTSVPKGKTYYIELYKSLEARLSECTDVGERTQHLCEAWRRVHSLCLHSAPSTHLHLLSWLQRHTARAVLQTGWQSPKRKDDRKRLEDAINDFIAESHEADSVRVGQVPPWETQLLARGEWFKTILDKPWDHPVLTLLLNPNGTPPSDEEVLKWLKQERGVTFVMRLHTLVGEKCEDIACSLASCVMDRVRAAMPQLSLSEEDDVPDKPTTVLYTGPVADKLRDEAGFTVDVWEMLTDIEFVLQHKRDSQRCIALAKQTPLRGAYQLIERLQCRLETSPREKRLWKNAKEVAILIAQVVIARCMVIPSCTGVARSALYCCARSLAHRAPARMLAAGAALAAPAPTARHLHTLAAAVRAHLQPSNDQMMKPFVCELYVRAITAGMNELEKLKLKTEKESESAARSAAQTLAAWLLQLGGVVAGRVAAECALTAFSLHPSAHLLACLRAVPPAAAQDKKEPKEEAKSEFGSWANDSRSMTNFVKTSETLNIKHTQNQANILSTAILNEGEGLGLSPELCQDIAVVLSGPRVKTFSWDMDREELLEKCRVYMERTQGGTRALTTELKYLNLDPASFQHLPEDRDDDEDDIYYGIEKGYEHLVQFEEPEQMWQVSSDPERTDSVSPNFLEDELVPRRKKKNRRNSITSGEDDPLSMVAEAKRHQKKKERPHSKERSRTKKERKKKQEEVDPLQTGDETQEQKVQKTKEKKERKPKEKAQKVRGDKLSSLVGLKIEKQKKKSKDASLQSLNSASNEADNKSIDSTISIGDKNSNNTEFGSANDKVEIHGKPVAKKPQNDANNFTYKPWEPVTNFRPPTASSNKKPSNFKAFPDDVRYSISKLLEFRRHKAADPNYRQPKMNAHMVQRKPPNAIINAPDVPIQTNISPKAVAIPEIPKSYIDKQQADKLAALKKGVDMIILQRKQQLEKTMKNHDSNTSVPSPVIQYAAKHASNAPATNPTYSYTKNQQPQQSSLKMSDIINVPTTDRQMMEKLQRQSSCSAIYDIVRPTSNVSKVAQERPASAAMSGQNDYLHFLKEYQEMRNRTTAKGPGGMDQVLDMSTKSPKETKKNIKPVSRVAPVVHIPTNNKAERKPQQSAKPPIQQNKPNASLNTFSRLSYMHKNKQTEMKNKAATEKSFSFSTYQEVSTELDEIIRKHKNEQMKVIQAKNEKELSKDTPTSSYLNSDDSRKYYQTQNAQSHHPMLTHLLEQNTITYTSTSNVCRNENQHKNSPTPEKPTSPPKSSLTNSDQNDILNLLRQQTKLNSAFYQTTSIYPSTSKSGGEMPHSSTMPVCNTTSYPIQQKSNTTKPVNVKSSLETKIINIISNSLIKPADNVNSKNASEAKAKPLITGKKNNKTDNQNKVKKTDSTKTVKEKKPTVISYVKNHSWETVMNDILKHKTPSRGPKALDVALNKSSFERVFENSLKEAPILPVAKDTKHDERKYQLKGQTLNPMVNPQYINTTTKKEGKILKQQPIQTKADDPKKPLNQSKPESSTNKKAVKANSSEISKKLPHEVQRKQFTYTGPKHDDPFISGIPNADYDLLEELMDDDLRKEIGELSSDEESFNTAAQSFLDPPKTDEKRVSVEFNVPHSESTIKKPAAKTQCLNAHLTTNEIIQKTSQSLVQKCDKVNNSVRNPQGVIPSVITQKNTTLKTVTAQNISVPTISHCSNVNTLTNTQINPNFYITAVPQQPPMQNVVLIGPELVYERYPTAQTSINNVSSIAPNAFVAVNNAPNMTLYQPTPFAAPIVNPMVISNTMNVPMINTVPCAATISVQTPINNVVEPTFRATSPEYTQINSGDINQKLQHTEIKQMSEKQDVNIKTGERKVLSEVQEKLAVTENAEKVKIQVTEVTDKNMKKDKSDDKERLKKKRMAIINRDIYHRCGNTPIALSYSPLPLTKNILDVHTNIPETLASMCALPNADKIHEQGISNEASLPNSRVHITNNIENISSPVTTDNNETCKENKNNPTASCRKILLRSKKTDFEIVIPPRTIHKKSKVKLKSEIPVVDKKIVNTGQNDKNRKDANIPKRASKRLRNKKVTKDLEGEKLNNLAISDQTIDTSKLIINNIQNDLLDIEAELVGSKIPVKPNSSLLQTDELEEKQNQHKTIIAPTDHILSDKISTSTGSLNETQSISSNTNDILKQTNDSGTNYLPNADNKEPTLVSDANTNFISSELEVISTIESNNMCTETLNVVKKSTVQESIANTLDLTASRATEPVPKVKNITETLELPCSTPTVNHNISNLLENNNIDLDMTVTEETNVTQRTQLLFADVKYGKAVSISDKGKQLTSTLLDTVPKVTLKEPKSDDSNENGLVNKPAEVTSNLNVNTTDVDDDIEIIDDKIKQPSSPKNQLRSRNIENETISQPITENINTTNKGTVNKPAKVSSISDNNTIDVDDDIQIISDNLNQPSFRTQNNIVENEIKNANKTATDAHPKYINDLSEISQSYKDRIIIEDLKNGDPTKKCVRVKLPNGKTFKATAYGDVNVNFDTLFAIPSVKATLLSSLNSLNNKNRYTMNINQITTVAKSDPRKIISTKIQAVQPTPLGLPPGQMETIDLLSDEEDESRSQVLVKQTLETEFGTFKISEMDKDILAQHQIKLRHKPIVQLNRLETTTGTNTDSVLNSNTEVLHNTKIISDKINDNIKSLLPKIPEQYVSGLINDIQAIEKRLSPDLPDVVEIDDDSSNDSIDLKCNEKLDPESKIDQLKDELLHELGVVNNVETTITTSVMPQIVKDSKNVAIAQEVISLDDDDSPNVQPNRDTIGSNSALNLSRDYKKPNKLVDKICCVKLIRCDDLIKQRYKSILNTSEENISDKGKAGFDSVASPVSTCEKQSDSTKNINDEVQTLEDFSFHEPDSNAIEADLERSSSPVIELFDVIASLGSNNYHLHKEYEPLAITCEADWFTTKQKLNLRYRYVGKIQPDIPKYNREYGSNMNVNNISATLVREKQLTVNVPTLSSLVLNILQDNVICQYELIRELNQYEGHSLKRKSTSMDANLTPKISKLDIGIEEPKMNESLLSCNDTLNSSTTDTNMSISILEDNKATYTDDSDLTFTNIHDDNVMSFTQKCDNNHNLNENCDKASENSNCEDLGKVQLVEDLSKEYLTDPDCKAESRSSSPIIEISHLLENDYFNDVDAGPISSPVLEISNLPSLVLDENIDSETETILPPEIMKNELALESNALDMISLEFDDTKEKSSPLDQSEINIILDERGNEDIMNNVYESDQSSKYNEIDTYQKEEEIQEEENVIEEVEKHFKQNIETVEPSRTYLKPESGAKDVKTKGNNNHESPEMMKATSLIEKDFKNICLESVKEHDSVNCTDTHIAVANHDLLEGKKQKNNSKKKPSFTEIFSMDSDVKDINTIEIVKQPGLNTEAEITCVFNLCKEVVKEIKEPNEPSAIKNSTKLLENYVNRQVEAYVVKETRGSSDKLSTEGINDKADSNDVQGRDQPCVLIKTELSTKSERKEDKSAKDIDQTGSFVESEKSNIEEKCQPSEFVNPDLSKQNKDFAGPSQIVISTKPNLLLDGEVEGEENTVSTTVTDEHEHSQKEELTMIIQNSSTAIIDHEYIASTPISCENKSFTQELENTINHPTHHYSFDEETTEEVSGEIIKIHNNEVIDIAHDKTDENQPIYEHKTDTDEGNKLTVHHDNITNVDCIEETFSDDNVPSDVDCCTSHDSRAPLEDCNTEELEDTVALWNVSVEDIDNTEITCITCNDMSTESIISKYLAMLSKDESVLTKTVKKIRYEDLDDGTYIVVPIVDKNADNSLDIREQVQASITDIQNDNVGVKDEDSCESLDNEFCEDLKIILPHRTYTKYSNKKVIRRSKRRMNMTDIQFRQKRTRLYKKNKDIEYSNSSKIEDVSYAKEYEKLFDYCSTINFSYSIPFHKEYIDVQKALKSWPIQGDNFAVEQGVIESREMLFIDTPERLSDHNELSFAEEIITEINENEYKSINITESNFSMGFGDGSGRVKQEQRDGEFTTFSAATLSDVKQLQPLLPSEQKHTSLKNLSDKINNENQDHRRTIRHFYDHLNLKEKVRSFFAKTQSELNFVWARDHKKDDLSTNWPFGLTSPEYIRPAPVGITVNVVQVGQLPVSAAAQNPVTCDPRVTHVSNVSPSQCSPQNNSRDDHQTSIKTEYTELTTADITLPLMQDYVQHHHSMPNESQEQHLHDENIPMATEIKSVVKIELMEETSQDQMEENIRYETHRLQLSESNVSNGAQYHYDNMTNNIVHESDANIQPVTNSSEEQKTISKNKQLNDADKTDQIAHAMNAAGISASQDIVKTSDAEALVDIITQNAQSDVVTSQTANYSKSAPITSMALQQALAQILPPPLNQTNSSENNQHSTANSQVLHIVHGNSNPSVINKANGTQVLHIVQNKSITNGTPTSQANTFSGLSLVDGSIQQNGNLLHIVNTGQKNSNNSGQLLKRVNLLTNLTNVQGSNDKMVHVLCKSADGKSIQLPPQRSMVLRLQPLDPPNLQTTAKPNEDVSSANATHPVISANGKETSSQEIKSRSLYEENYAKFVQNGDPKPSQEKATSLPKFNQVFGKQVYQDKQNEIENNNMGESPSDCPPEENITLEQMTDIASPPMLIRKSQNQTTPQAPQAQPNLVQQIKQTIGPMNIPMHGGVIYTRQIPVNIGNGQTINLITVPSTEIVDDSNHKLHADGKFGNQGGDSPIIKIVQNNQTVTTTNGTSEDNNAQMGSANETKPQQAPQPQPVLTQMRIKLPMLSKAPQMVGGTRVVRPSFFQIQRNVIGGANQQVYQQLVLTAAPQIGQSIRLPAQAQKPKTPSETQSSPESQMSSSTLEQLREFDMVLEQVKERSTVQPGTSTSNNNFSKLSTSADTTDAATPSTSTIKQDAPTPVLFSVGTTQSINIANFVNRKSTITSTTTSSFVRSPDSTGITESPSSSTHVHLPHTASTTESCASSSCASEAVAATSSQPKPKKKSKPKSSSSTSNPFKINSTPPKTSTQKPLEDEQTTQRILYILAEYKEQVENSPDKDKPAPRRRNNPAAPTAGTSKRKKSSSGSRKRDYSPIGEDSCRTMGSEDSSCGTSLGECNECLESHSPEDSPRKVVRRLTFEQETTQVTQTRTTTIPQRNVIVADGQAFAVRGTTGKPATTVLMPANYLLPVSMMKGGQQIAIVTNRGPKLLVGAGEGGTGGTLLFQRLIGPAGLKPVLTRPGVRHIRLPTAALHNLQTFNIAAPAAAPPPDSTASPAPAPPDLGDSRAMSSPWPDRSSDAGDPKPDKGNSSPEGSEPWNLPSSSIADDYGYEEIVRTDNMDRTVLDAIPDRYSPDMEAQRIFDKMFDVDSKKSMYDSRCSYDIDASDDDKPYHQVVQRKDGRHHRLTHVSAAALRHKYAILEHELRLQKSLSEECEDLGVDSPSASELFPEAELLFAPSPAHEQTIDQCHTPQPSLMSQGIPQPDLDDQIASDRLLTPRHDADDLDINLDDVGEIVTVGEDGMTTIQLDHEEFARSHPNTTFHSEPEDGEVPPFTIAQGLKGRPITFGRGVPATVVMGPQTTVISQATVQAAAQHTVKFSDIDNIINAMPNPPHQPTGSSVLVKDDGLHKYDILNEREQLPASVVHSTGNGTQVIRRAETRYSDDELRRDDKIDDRRDESSGDSGPERADPFWESGGGKRFEFGEKCCEGHSGRQQSVIKAARRGGAAPALRTYPARRRDERARRGVVKRGCHCCGGGPPPPKPKKSKKRPGDFHSH